jgi:hypothetical protein
MNDNQDDLILVVHIEPVDPHRGLRMEAFENIVGVRRDNYMSIWQAIVFMDNIDTYPVVLSIFSTKLIAKFGSLIGYLLGYQTEYDEYTTRTSID